MVKMFAWLHETLLNAHKHVAMAWLKHVEVIKAQQKVSTDAAAPRR